MAEQEKIPVRSRLRRDIKRWLVRIAGAGLIIAGVISGFLPFLQGWVFIAIGIIMISVTSKKINAWTESHTRRFPKLHALIQKMQSGVLRVIGPKEDLEE